MSLEDRLDAIEKMPGRAFVGTDYFNAPAKPESEYIPPPELPPSDITEDLVPAVENINHPLFPIMVAAIDQAIRGKGQRHGGGKIPFLEQPWKHYADMHGRGFLTGQAAKKLEEAASTRDGGAFETEVLGAIVFAAMAILYERS